MKKKLLSEQLSWALSYLKPHIPALSGIFVLFFSQSYAFSMLPMASTNFLFELLTPEKISRIYKYFALAMGVLVANSLLAFVGGYFKEVINNAAIKRIRDDIFGHLMMLDFKFFTEHKTGNIVSIGISDVEEIKNLFYQGIISFFTNFSLLFIVIVRLVILNWVLTLVSFAMMPLMFFLVRVIGKKIRAVSKEYRKNLGSLTSNIHETLSGIEVVKAFANEAWEAEEYGKKTRTYRDTSSKLARYQKFLEPFTELVIYFVMMLIIGVGSIFIIRGEWELKQLTEYMMLLGIMNMPVRSIPRIIANFKVTAASVDRIRSLLAEQPRVVESPHPVVREIDGVIDFADVRFSYDSKNDVLHGVTFHADKGDVVALVGPSGAGKTTVANLIPRFYDCRDGAVLIDGVDIRKYGIRSLRTQVGIVSQNISLFNTTIRDNIMYAKRDASEREIIEAAKKAYAYDFIMELPKRFDTNVGERGVKLSGGQKQRISIARTILMDPKILILDEATSALDSESERFIQLAVGELMSGRTSVIIAHRLSTVSHASKIVVIEKGRVVDVGSHDELLSRCALYQKIHELQYFR